MHIVLVTSIIVRNYTSLTTVSVDNCSVTRIFITRKPLFRARALGQILEYKKKKTGSWINKNLT